MSSHTAKTMSGKTVTYTSREALNRAKARRKDVIVDSWPANDGPPTNSDGRAWDAWRHRQGRSGIR